jgi:hypothetical protein
MQAKQKAPRLVLPSDPTFQAERAQVLNREQRRAQKRGR